MPQLLFPDIKDYELHNSAFDIGTAAILNAKSLDLFIDGTLVKTIMPNPNNMQLAPSDRLVDPSTVHLADGIHALTYIVYGNTGNGTMYRRFFTIDRRSTFTDVPMNYWAFPVIEALHDLGSINGQTRSLFAPDTPITRAEFATMFARILQLDTTSSTEEKFSDVPVDAWYKPYVDALADKGFIHGVSSGDSFKFEPDQPITRADAAMILANQIRIS